MGRSTCNAGDRLLSPATLCLLLALAAPLLAATDPDATTPLHWAAYRNDLAAATAALRAGANPNAANRDGATPMFLAAQNGSAPIIEKLLAAGVDPNAPVLAHGET